MLDLAGFETIEGPHPDASKRRSVRIPHEQQRAYRRCVAAGKSGQFGFEFGGDCATSSQATYSPPVITYGVAWHARMRIDPAHLWLRKTLIAAFAPDNLPGAT